MAIMWQEMTSSVLNRDIMVRKGVFWNIGAHLYFVYYHIISYQSIKVCRVKTMDIGRFRLNNGVSGKYNTSKYFGIIVQDDNPLVEVIRC